MSKKTKAQLEEELKEVKLQLANTEAKEEEIDVSGKTLYGYARNVQERNEILQSLNGLGIAVNIKENNPLFKLGKRFEIYK